MQQFKEILTGTFLVVWYGGRVGQQVMSDGQMGRGRVRLLALGERFNGSGASHITFNEFVGGGRRLGAGGPYSVVLPGPCY